jgi:phage gp16-like protein
MSSATTAAFEVKLIQIGRRALQLDDGTYRDMLARFSGGKTSSTALTAAERQQVLAHMKASGFVVKPKSGSKAAAESGWQRAPQMRKLRAMWYVLADAGEVDPPADMDACNAAIETWAKRQLEARVFSALRFATGPQMDKLIESLKMWLGRLGLATD